MPLNDRNNKHLFYEWEEESNETKAKKRGGRKVIKSKQRKEEEEMPTGSDSFRGNNGFRRSVNGRRDSRLVKQRSEVRRRARTTMEEREKRNRRTKIVGGRRREKIIVWENFGIYGGLYRFPLWA